MSESQEKSKSTAKESPYYRIALLAGVIVIVLAAIFGANFIARAFNGKDKDLMAAVMNSLQQPRIDMAFSSDMQAQTNTFDLKGSLSVDELKKARLSVGLNLKMGETNVEVPIEAYGDAVEGKAYVKVDNATKLADTLGAYLGPESGSLQSLAKTANGKWVQAYESEGKKDESCTTKLAAAMRSDKAAQDGLAYAYKKARFLKVTDHETKGDKQVYTVELQDKGIEKFIKQLRTEKFFKGIKGCNGNYDPFGIIASSEAARTQASSAQNQAATKTAESENSLRVVVEGDKVTSLATSSSQASQVNALQMSVAYDKSRDALVAPTKDIVPMTAISKDLEALSKLFVQSAQQQQQSMSPQGMYPQQ